MSEHDCDIAILGGGPAGSALALLLAQTAPDPAQVVLLRTGARAGASDPRVLALNHGSKVLLQSLHAWPQGAADIHTIHVSQRGRLGRTLIKREDFGVPQLGSVARYARLQEALQARLAQSGVRIVQGPAATLESETADGAVVRSGDMTLRCRVAVQADGAPAPDVRREYGQHAVLATAVASRPRPGWAWERFTREGPLALLPHPDGGGTHAVVWCCAPTRAAELASADDAAFSLALNDAFGDRLGRLQAHGPRHVFPLAMVLRRRPAGRCVAAIGNAAQTLHPVAGQGLNLGLRDAARLAMALRPWLAQPAGDPAPALAAFGAARRPDRWLTAGVTDFLPRIFATGLAPVEHAAGLALLALDLARPLRAPLARHLLHGLRA